jgi:hypothetical protein
MAEHRVEYCESTASFLWPTGIYLNCVAGKRGATDPVRKFWKSFPYLQRNSYHEHKLQRLALNILSKKCKWNILEYNRTYNKGLRDRHWLLHSRGHIEMCLRSDFPAFPAADTCEGQLWYTRIALHVCKLHMADPCSYDPLLTLQVTLGWKITDSIERELSCVRIPWLLHFDQWCTAVSYKIVNFSSCSKC